MGAHPRERVRSVSISTPANTAQAAPQSTNWTVGHGALERVDVVIPDGHVGLTGLRILWGGRQVVPYDGAEFLVGNADKVTVELGLWNQAGVLVVQTFNTDDTYAHAFVLRAYVTDLEVEPSLGGAPVAVLAGEAGLEEQVPSAPSLELSLDDVAALRAAGYDPSSGYVMGILEDILSNTQAILDAIGAGSAPAAGAPGGELGGEVVLPALVAVPSVVGLPITVAGPALEAVGLGWAEADVPSGAPAGTVTAQDPPGGMQVDPAQVMVALTVAVAQAPPAPAQVAVPDVVGMQQSPGASALRAAGFAVSVVTTVDPSVPRFQIVKQQPRAGAMRATGTTVTITVAHRQ